MNKLTAIRIKNDDNTYSDQIPISVLAENVQWDSTHSLIDIIGEIDVDTIGNIQEQIDNILNRLQTDTSLSISGKFADAKATGDAINNLRGAVGSPLVAATIAAMSDTNKVYVYTGSEPGYTNGNWYYHNGISWVSGGVYNSIAVDLDSTLTISGKASDSKSVGDVIGELKENLNNISDYVKTIEYAWREGYRIATNTNPVDINAIYASPAYSCQILEVKKGEKYILTAKQGNNVYNAYCFTDINLNKIEVSKVGTYEDSEITAPSDGYLIVCTENRNYQRLIRYEVLSFLVVDNQQAKEDIARIDYSCKNIETITFPESFYEKGTFGSSGRKADTDYAIRTINSIPTSRPVTIIPNSGYRVLVVIYSAEGVYESQTAQHTDAYTVPANKRFKFALSHTNSTQITEIYEKVNALVVGASYDEYMSQKNLQAKIDYEWDAKTSALTFFASRFGNESNVYGRVYYVDPNGSGHTTIASAVAEWAGDNYPDATIYIRNGEYNESITVEGKTVRFIGESRDECIVHTTSGNYTDPPFNVRHGNVTIKNMTLIADHSENPDFDYEAQPTLKAYGIHIDGGTVGGIVTVENCNIISFQAPAVGSGTIPNSKIRLVDCDCYCFTDYTNDTSTAQYSKLIMGCIFWHTSNPNNYPARGTEEFELINVRAYMQNFYIVLKTNQSAETDTMNMLSINTLLYSARNPNNQSPLAGPVTPAVGSIGNNVGWLDA